MSRCPAVRQELEVRQFGDNVKAHLPAGDTSRISSLTREVKEEILKAEQR